MELLTGLLTVEDIAFGALDVPAGDRLLVVLSGGFGVLVSRLPKSVSDRSMVSPENVTRCYDGRDVRVKN
jgi:hypothetical protein